MHYNSHGFVIPLFSKHVGCMEAEVVAILETLWIFFLLSIQVNLIVQSDSLNALYWVSSSAKFLWRLQFYLREIKTISFLV